MRDCTVSNVQNKKNEAASIQDLKKAQNSAVEDIAENVRAISDAFKQLMRGPLNERAIVLLLSDLTQLPKTTVRKVLNGLGEIEKRFLVPAKKAK